MQPQPARVGQSVPIAELCVQASRLARGAFSPEEARVALGSISNLYCLWALDKPDMPPLMVRGFVATEVAEEGHIDQQIVGSIPRVGLMLARQIREALDQAFGEVERENQTARIRGFGVFQRAPDGNEWTLTVELPLAESLGAGPHHSYP